MSYLTKEQFFSLQKAAREGDVRSQYIISVKAVLQEVTLPQSQVFAFICRLADQSIAASWFLRAIIHRSKNKKISNKKFLLCLKRALCLGFFKDCKTASFSQFSVFFAKDEHLSFLKKSLFEIGMYYYRTKDKLATAIYYLYQAGLAGSALGWYNLGVLVRKEFKDDVLASEYFLKAANLGCHRADFNLAWLGLAEKIDISKHEAVSHLDQACHKKMPEAFFLQGILYREGQVVKQDAKRAEQCFLQAINSGLPVERLKLEK